MRMIFDFEGDEVASVMEAVANMLEKLREQPRSRERDAQMFALGRFTVKMTPIIEAGKRQEANIFKDMMN